MYVKRITYMNNYNVFSLLIYVVFSMSPLLGVTEPKAQDLVIYFSLGEVETLPQLHLRVLLIRSENLLFQDETRQINNLTSKYIMEMSKLKHLQRFMTRFELAYKTFERLALRKRLSNTFKYTKMDKSLKI